MALHNLKIIVVDGGKTQYGAGGVVNNGGDNADSQSDNAINKSLTQGFKSFLKTDVSAGIATNMKQSIALIKQIGRSTFDYYVSDIGRRNGDSNYQAQINRKIERVTDVTSVISSTISGAQTGAMGGPIGAVVGAGIGLMSGLFANSMKYAERERAYAHEMFKQNNSQAYNLARANYSATTGRKR